MRPKAVLPVLRSISKAVSLELLSVQVRRTWVAESTVATRFAGAAEGRSGSRVSVAICELPPVEAVSVILVVLVTRVFATWKLMELAPAGTVTLVGGTAEARLLESVTGSPPAG